MRLAAGAAVAMHDRSGIGSDFVGHASAQAGSSEHGDSLNVPLYQPSLRAQRSNLPFHLRRDGLLRCARKDADRSERTMTTKKPDAIIASGFVIGHPTSAYLRLSIGT